MMKGNRLFRRIGKAKNEEMLRILYTEASKLGNADAIAMLGLIHTNLNWVAWLHTGYGPKMVKGYQSCYSSVEFLLRQDIV